jgi:hypothetical protein
MGGQWLFGDTEAVKTKSGDRLRCSLRLARCRINRPSGQAHEAAAEAGIGGTGREPAGSESVGIRDEAFLADLKMRLGPKGIHKSAGVLGPAARLSVIFG